jgi:hypothetical protein
VKEKSDLIDREQYWLDKKEAVVKGYNIAPKANSMAGIPLSEERRKQLAEINRGRKRSEEHKEKIRQAMTGRQLSKESKEKISKALTGVKPSSESREKRRNTIRERGLSDKQKAAISKVMKGRTFSEETKRKLSESQKGKVISAEQKAKIAQTLMKRPPFTDEELNQIKALLLQGLPLKAIGNQFGCSTTPIQHLRDALTEEELQIRNDSKKGAKRNRSKN